jgi:hypothetical protein
MTQQASPSAETRLQAALLRLQTGRPEHTDGRLTVKNLCAEAQVPRASFYRSARAAEFQQLLNDPGQQPQAEQQRRQASQRKAADKEERSQNAADLREAREQVKIYANHIQVLTLRLTQLAEEHAQLLARVERDAGIARLPAPRQPA